MIVSGESIIVGKDLDGELENVGKWLENAVGYLERSWAF